MGTASTLIIRDRVSHSSNGYIRIQKSPPKSTGQGNGHVQRANVPTTTLESSYMLTSLSLSHHWWETYYLDTCNLTRDVRQARDVFPSYLQTTEGPEMRVQSTMRAP